MVLQELKHELQKSDESGILARSGPAFRTPSDFALKNLSYVIWSNRYTCNRSYSVTHNCIPCYSLIYVMDGSLEVFTAGKQYIVNKEEAILIDFSREHSYRCISETAVKWELIIKGDLVRSYSAMIEESWGVRFSVTGRVAVVLEKIQRALGNPMEQDHKLACLLQRMFCEIIDQNTNGLSPEVVRAIQYMYDNYENDIHVEDIAEIVSFSRSYFTRVFAKETGYTPKEFLLNVRINVAQDLLSGKKDLTMLDIAEQCGFSNASHFCRLFKQKTGKSPRKFRAIRGRW